MSHDRLAEITNTYLVFFLFRAVFLYHFFLYSSIEEDREPIKTTDDVSVYHASLQSSVFIFYTIYHSPSRRVVCDSASSAFGLRVVTTRERRITRARRSVGTREHAARDA